jgi:DNA-directed RNA polymerase specialized sigma subunit
LKKYRDDICRIGKCVNLEVCVGLCPFLRHVNGRGKSKEVLLSNLTKSENLEYRDYKSDIAELAEDIEEKEQRRTERLELILSEPNSEKKFITLALLAGFKVPEIAEHCRVHRSWIYQIIKKAP